MPRPEVRRALLLLSLSYALMWAAVSVTAGPGPAALVTLTGDRGLAGLYFALFSLAAAAGGALGGRLMDRVGRRRVLLGGHVLGAFGYATLGLGVRGASVATFVAGVLLLALGTGAAYLTRLAAAEMLPPERRARGMALVLAGAAVGALAGPALLFALGPLGGDTQAVWFIAAPLPLGAAALVALAPESTTLAHRAPAAARASADAPPRRTLVAGFAALGLSQAAMVGVMGVAGAALAHDGHGVREMAGTLALHFVGMFALAPLVGVVADKAGRRPTILAGIATLAAGALVVALDRGLATFVPGLFLVGLGWSFAYVGATTLVTEVAPAASRGRVLGLADLGGSVASAFAATGAGLWFATNGLPALGLAAAALMLVPLALVLAIRERAPGRYGSEGAVGA